jgi:hypothetical protein
LVDYRKIDAALAAALEDVSDLDKAMLSVFVHVDPKAPARQRAGLARLGLPKSAVAGGITTASLTPQAIDQLSEHPSVTQLRLSTPLNLLGDQTKPLG